MPAMNTGDFDVIFKISTNRFLDVLQNLILNELHFILHNIPITVPLPAAINGQNQQKGTFSLSSQQPASITLDPQDANGFILSVSFSNSLLTLDQILPAVGGVGLNGLAPSDAGPATLTLHLNIDTTTVTGPPAKSPITIKVNAANGPTISNPLPKLVTLPLAVPAPDTSAQWQNAVQDAIQNGVRDIIEAYLPIIEPIDLPDVSQAVCGLVPQRLQMKFLPAPQGNTQLADCLGFFVGLQKPDAGSLGPFVNSDLPSNLQASLLVAAPTVLKFLCCILPQSEQIQGLGTPSSPTQNDMCCRWTNQKGVTIGGTPFDLVPLLQICIVNGGFALTISVHQSGTGWWAQSTVSTSVTFSQQGGTLNPNVAKANVHVDWGVEWWVWLIAVVAIIVGAIIGGIIGGWIGGVIGGVIGLVVGVVILVIAGFSAVAAAAAIGTVLGNLSGVLGGLRLLPDDLTKTFGSLDLVGNPVIDDLLLFGNLVLPPSYPTLAGAADLILQIGEAIDLDTGNVIPAQKAGIDPEADLLWTLLIMPTIPTNNMIRNPHIIGFNASQARARTTYFPTVGSGIFAVGSASLLQIGGGSFTSLTANDLKSLLYPNQGGTIPITSIPLSDLSNPTDMVVFGARTTEGFDAKCAAWRDTSNRLHLRYETFQTPVSLRMTAQWIVKRGSVVDYSAGAFSQQADYEISRHGTFTAVADPPIPNPSYDWLWEGNVINGTGNLPNSSTSFQVTNDVCELTTAMGEDLSGTLCVRTSNPGGIQRTICRHFNLSGIIRISSHSTIVDQATSLQNLIKLHGPGPAIDPGPVSESRPFSQQLLEALRAGMRE